ALHLALYAQDDATAELAVALLVRDAAAAQSVAVQLARRGHHAWAARLLEGAGLPLAAARAWDEAGDTSRAALLLEREGAPSDAEHVLQAALRRDPDAPGIAGRLGALLARFGKWEAAVRALQRVPSGVPERHEALVHLVRVLRQLGLPHAAREASAELESLGAPATIPSDSSHAASAPGREITALSLPPPLFGRYDPVREVASTPNARVLECVDLQRGGHVAVKLFAREARDGGRDAVVRFEHDVLAMRSLDHPNVVAIRDFVDEPTAIILAWMGGGTLEEMLEAHGPFAPARAAEITYSILGALGAAHRLGIVHGNVRPTNILFDQAGSARLSDFGVAHLTEMSATLTAEWSGALSYMSPEQRQGHPAGVRSDIFGVGVMLREMLTGERPERSDAPRLLPSQANRHLDARHDLAVARMAAVDPQSRPADTFEARASLAALPWSDRPGVHLAPPGADIDSSDVLESERMHPQVDGTALDRWTDRVIDVIPLTERTLARARAFALADHRGLQVVWRVDKKAGTIWLGHLEGAQLSRPLTLEERACLEDALDALHAADGVHGRVDAQHVVVARSGVILRFGRPPSTATVAGKELDADHDAIPTAESDRIALARL
ncbi:MAG: protein kinase, partial [Myxococcota bacterium]|nr:protein kinase [Myxococcota bacterium]